MSCSKFAVALLALVPAAAVFAQDPAAAGALATDDEKISYTIGTQLGKSLDTQTFQFSEAAFMQGLNDAKNKAELKVTQAEMQKLMGDLNAKMQQEMQAKRVADGEKNKADGAAYLAENGAKEGWKTTASGLQYKPVTEGTGPKPTTADTVRVHYRGTLTNGEQFDSSYDRGEPAEFPVTGVIKGWTEALQLMGVGSKYELVIPSDLAYGERGNRGIAPNSVLKFEVELLDIVKTETDPNTVTIPVQQ